MSFFPQWTSFYRHVTASEVNDRLSMFDHIETASKKYEAQSKRNKEKTSDSYQELFNQMLSQIKERSER